MIKIWFLFTEEIMKPRELSDVVCGYRAVMNAVSPAEKTA